MNGWGGLFFLASFLALSSLPLVLFAILMRLVGRIGTRSLIFIVAADSIPWAMAAFSWWGRTRG
jgi:hypothetical protein